MTMKPQRIEGAVALVTGANRGIGRALTEALLTRGVRKVYGAVRNPETLRTQRDERLVPLQLDLTDADQIRAAVDAASDVEMVFNNAGVALARSTQLALSGGWGQSVLPTSVMVIGRAGSVPSRLAPLALPVPTTVMVSRVDCRPVSAKEKAWLPVPLVTCLTICRRGTVGLKAKANGLGP